jgi:hypothetical protein
MLAAAPQPPVHLQMPDAEIAFTLIGAVPLIVAVVIAARHIRGGQGPLLLFCLIGGAFASLFEPFVDVMGLVYLTESGSIGTFTLLDRTMPLFVPLMYPWYIGGLAYLTCRRFERGITTKGVFQLWGVFILVNFALELPGLLTDVYTYYGKQPFDIWGHPLWWGCANAFTALAAGAMVFGVKRFLGTGWGLAGVIPLIFVSEGLSNAGAGWPMYATLGNDGLGYAWTYGAAVVTVGLIAYGVWIISLVATRAGVGGGPGTGAATPGVPVSAAAEPPVPAGV